MNTPGVCRICGRVFRSLSGLHDHERRHRGIGPYNCCGKTYYSRAHFDRHRCSTHKAEQAFECCVCNTKFATGTDLRWHKKREDKIKSFKCETCGLSFQEKADIMDTLYMHEGVKTHVCSRCGKAFVHRSSLSRHKKRCRHP